MKRILHISFIDFQFRHLKATNCSRLHLLLDPFSAHKPQQTVNFRSGINTRQHLCMQMNWPPRFHSIIRLYFIHHVALFSSLFLRAFLFFTPDTKYKASPPRIAYCQFNCVCDILSARALRLMRYTCERARDRGWLDGKFEKYKGYTNSHLFRP